MRVQFYVVGQVPAADKVTDFTVEMEAVPREGDVVNVPGISQAETVVRTVVWFPVPDPGEEVDAPFVYVVLGSPRRT